MMLRIKKQKKTNLRLNFFLFPVKPNQLGLSLLTILLSIAIIGILAVTVYRALDPNSRIRDLRANKRLLDAKALEDAINRYSFQNGAEPTSIQNFTDRQSYVIVPANITYNSNVACDSVLGYLATTSISDFATYLATTPTDPEVTDLATYGSGYYLRKIDGTVRAGSCYQAYNFNNGLVGLWKMDEDSWNGTAGEAKDWSNNNVHGQAIAGVNTTNSNYKTGSHAGSWNGSTAQYLSFPYDADLNLTTSITLAAWMYTNSTSRQVIVGRNFQWQLYIIGASLGMYLRRGPTEPVYPNTFVQVAANIGLSTGSWQHVAATWEPGTVKFYLNGNLMSTNTVTGCAEYGNCAPSAPLYNVTSGSGEIGLYWNHSAYYWNGQLDEVGVWNRVLSPEEITALYQTYFQ